MQSVELCEINFLDYVKYLNTIYIDFFFSNSNNKLAGQVSINLLFMKEL